MSGQVIAYMFAILKKVSSQVITYMFAIIIKMSGQVNTCLPYSKDAMGRIENFTDVSS